jgi:hypothetical protein
MSAVDDEATQAAYLVHTLNTDFEPGTSISQHLTGYQLDIRQYAFGLPQVRFQAVIGSSLDSDSHTSRLAQLRESKCQL